MALVVRATGNVINATDPNQYHDLLTGAMTDQPVLLSYAPASTTTTPTLQLKTNGNAPLLQALNGTTQEALLDASGNLTLNGTATIGVVSSNPAFKVLANGVAQVYGSGVINGGSGYAYLAQLLSLGGGAPGAHIWQGTTDPGASAQEGDLWVVG